MNTSGMQTISKVRVIYWLHRSRRIWFTLVISLVAGVNALVAEAGLGGGKGPGPLLFKKNFGWLYKYIYVDIHALVQETYMNDQSLDGRQIT